MINATKRSTAQKARHWMLFLCLSVLTLGVKSQSIYFSFKDGTQASYNLVDVLNITFTGDVMNLNKNDGTTLSWNVSAIGNYRYEQVSVNINEVENTAELVIYPNPSNGNFNISYQLFKAEQVGIHLFDMQGRLVKTWATEQQTAGIHQLRWQGDKLAQGSYLLRFTTPKCSVSKTIIVQ
jgi:Secretion system C-terminal sorting domain